MSDEVWREIPGWEGYYEVSTHGNYRSMKRRKGINCKPTLSIHGYFQAALFDRKKEKHFTTGVHRLVAKAFIENPNNFPCVHHKDHNKKNNYYSNLEWVTYSQNIKYNYSTGGQIGKTNMKGKFGVMNPGSIKINIFDMSGKMIDSVVGISEAARKYNACPSHIVKVCTGKLNKHRNLIWRYA